MVGVGQHGDRLGRHREALTAVGRFVPLEDVRSGLVVRPLVDPALVQARGLRQLVARVPAFGRGGERPVQPEALTEMHHAGSERALELGEHEKAVGPQPIGVRVGAVHERSPAQQPAALSFVGRDVDHRPRHADGTVEHRLVGLGRDARRGELGLMVRGREAVEPEHRMDARDRERDVRHVRRPRDALRERRENVEEPAAEVLGVRAVVGGHHACRGRTRCTRGQP